MEERKIKKGWKSPEWKIGEVNSGEQNIGKTEKLIVESGNTSSQLQRVDLLTAESPTFFTSRELTRQFDKTIITSNRIFPWTT